MSVVETICRKKKQLFSKICFPSRTVTRRIEEMSEDVKSSQQSQLKYLQYLSIAILVFQEFRMQ